MTRARGVAWVLAALVVAGAATEYARRARVANTTPDMADPGAFATLLPVPVPLEPFSAKDLDGRDVSTSTWRGKVVIVNFWATWCAPCRREIPALAALQDKYRDRLLIIGVLQDNVTADFARKFGDSVRMNYPIVPTTWEIERSFPMVLALPMTFIIDQAGRVVAAHAGEIDPAEVGRQVEATLKGPTVPGGREGP